MSDTPAPNAPAAPAADPAAPAAQPAADPSLLDGVTPGDPAAPADPAAAGDDWLPEKFRVTGADGKLDESASARKLADSYKALEAHKGELPQVPATPEDYKLEAPKGEDGEPSIDQASFDAFTSDPLFQAFAKDAHAEGLSNKQLQFVVEKYLGIAPQLLAADQKLSLEEAKAELGAIWKDDKTIQANLSGVVRAINGFGAEAEDVPGSRARLMEKYGRDPDFIAFAAAVAGEMKEDALPNGITMSSDADIDSLQKSKAYWDPNDPEHAQVKAKVDAHYARKHGTKRR